MNTRDTMNPINPKGFSLIELIISMAILGLVLAALASLFASQNKHHAAQNEIIEMQGNARAAMEFVTRTMKGISGSDTVTIANAGMCDSSITFMAVEDFGMATGGGSTTLTDTRKNWSNNQWKNFRVAIARGTGSGQMRIIGSNAKDTLTLKSGETNWSPSPDTTSEYRILSFNGFSRTAADNIILRYSRNEETNQPLALNITCFTVQSTGSPITRLNIIITAETQNPLPTTGRKASITLRSSVDIRN